jgi:2-polyprenyl-3-methyl-5-hydroxy-6-metoxy-1,4-benzoquinol methylase
VGLNLNMIRAEIEDHYRQGAERGRLEAAQGELERVRTQDILRRYLPAPPAVVFDVGGASGAYAFPLAAQGYQVHLNRSRATACGTGTGAFGGRGG